jgi:hypothetical protein
MGRPIRPLKEFDSYALFELATYEPGTYLQDTQIQGNSLLSTLFVSSLDPGAVVTVSYEDFTVGQSEGEIYPLTAHPPVDTAQTANRTIVTKIHNQPRCRVSVTGGKARFSVYVTVVSSFATDLDASLVFEAQLADFLRNKGMPVMGFDPADNSFRFIRATNGRLNVELSGDIDANPTALNKRLYGASPGLLQGATASHVLYVVPEGKRFTWLSGYGAANGYTTWRVRINGVPALTKRNAFDQRDVPLSLGNPVVLLAGEEIAVEVKNSSPCATMNEVETWIYGNEEDTNSVV